MVNASAQVVVFCLDKRDYGVRLLQVVRVIRSVDCTPLPQAPGIVLGVIDLQGEIVPVLNIRRRFGFAEREVGLDDQFIIAFASRRKVALVVDGVKGVVECPADNIIAAGKIIAGAELIEGVIQLEDGLTLIHDLDRFLSLDEQQTLEQSLSKQPSHGN